MSSIEAENQANADYEKDMQSIKAVLGEIQLDEADVSEAYEVRMFLCLVDPQYGRANVGVWLIGDGSVHNCEFQEVLGQILG